MKKGICYLLTLALMITAVPMQVFGASAQIETTTKVVGVKQYGTDSDGRIYGEDSPQLRMKVEDFVYRMNSEKSPSIDFDVFLENAVFMDADGDDFNGTDQAANVADAIRLLTYYNGERIINASYDSKDQMGWFDADEDNRYDSSDEIMIEAFVVDSYEIEYTLTGILEENDQIWVDLQSRMEKMSVGSVATVSVTDDIEMDAISYAEIIKQGLVKDDFNDTANIEAVAEAVNGKDYPKGFHGEIYLDAFDLPEVQLRLTDIDRKSSDEKIMTEFTVLLDNAFFVNTKGVKFHKGRNSGEAVLLAAYVKDGERVKASYDAKRNLGWFDANRNGVYDAEEITVAAEVYGKNEIRYSVIGDLQEKDIISVCLQSQMEGIGLDKVATVSVESDMCYLDSKIFAEIRLQNIGAELDDEIDLLKESPVTLGKKNNLTIEPTVGNFVEGQEIQLKLNSGFAFTENCTGENSNSVALISGDEDTLVYRVEAPDDDPKVSEVEIAGEDIEIMATSAAQIGDTAVLYVKAVENKDVKGTFESEQVSVEVGEVQNAMTLELDAGRRGVSPGESWEVDDLVLGKRDGFSSNDEVKLELSDGFTFVSVEKLEMNNTIKLDTDECEADRIVFSPSEDCGKELEIQGLSIAADSTLEDGDRARLTFNIEGYTSTSRIVATVNVEETEVEDDELELDVREVEIEAGGKAVFKVLGVDRGNKFTKGDELTLTLSDGFSFVEGNKFYDGDGTEIKWKFLSENQIIVLAPSNPGQGFDLEELMIAADEGLTEGAKATMTVSMEGYDPVTEVVATVVSEAKEVAAGELNLNVEKLQLKAGGEASFENLSIGKTVKFKAGEEITLKLSRGFSFVKGKFYDGDRTTVIQVEDWDEDEIVIEAPEDPGFGFDLIGLTIAADEDLNVDEEAILMVKMRGYDAVKESVAVVVGEPSTGGARSGLELDVRPVNIVAGDESSYEILGIDKDRRITREEFTEGDKVTLKLSEGFSFVENDKFYDGDGTRIWVDTWDENEIVVVAPRDPGMGFDIEELTIVADEGLEVGTEATMTASMAGYAPVTEVVATVVEARASSDVTMLGDVTCDGKVSAQDLFVLASHVDGDDIINDNEALANADVTKDGRITIADVKKLARYIGKIIDEL